ncbi:MAG: cysteine--tRNA ligase [Oscillospiraceae bacterium]|nr:cysteine--tRNA ligase [Oscillospiraceae bacterium]
MKLFNTMTMQKEEFVPIEEGKVRMYACGPTVYNYIDVGNARPMIMFDVLRRYLEYRGYEVTFVQNFTDVDDKIINRALEEGITSEEVAQKYIEDYFRDARALGVRPATVHPKATENIANIIEMVKTLEEKGFAYAVNGDVYYRTGKFSDYGKLSHQPLEELQAGARIDVNDVKENPMDFALWKAAKPGEPSWDSPWGKGRPGWHIECSAMSNRYLGKTIDLHCGGQDLTFPHHENEVAQSEAANGCKFVNYWVHNGFINIDNKKMSKSLGNFFTVREAAQAYGYSTIRMFMLMSHYRSPLNYSGEILIQAQNALEQLTTAYNNLKFLMDNGADGDMTARERELAAELAKYRPRFIEKMDDDFNTADGIAVIFELVREINSAVAENPTKTFAKASFDLLDELQGVLGLIYEQAPSDDDEALKAQVEALINARQEARAARNWAEADRIRDELKDMGIVLMDTKQGVQWKKG